MKKTVNALGIVIILLLLLQIVVMFMPYFDFTARVEPDRKGNMPKGVFSLQDYCWMDTEDMGKNFFKKDIENYNVNDEAVPLVLTFAIACVAVILNVMNFANSFNTYITFRAGLITVLTHIISGFWCYIAINAYLTSQVLPLGDQQLYMVSLITIFAATALIALRLVVQVTAGIVKSNKARKARIAARQAA